MFRGGTVKQFKDAIEVMREVYPFKDDNAYMAISNDFKSMEPGAITIKTKDEKTGVLIELFKEVDVRKNKN